MKWQENVTHERGQERKPSLETDPDGGIISMLKHLVDNKQQT